LLGIGLIVLAQLFTGGQFVSEEKLLAGQNIHPLLCIGLEGFWGCFFFAIILPIFQHVSCDPTSKLCHVNPITHVPTIEDSIEAWGSIISHKSLFLMSVGILCSIAFFNATGVAITKYASSSQRSTIDTSRTMVIWLINMALGKEKFIFG